MRQAEQKRNIVLLLWEETEDGVSRYVIDGIQKSVMERGYRTRVQSMTIPNPYSALDKAVAGILKEICLVFSLNGVGFETMSMGNDRWMNTMPCLCISYFWKDPVYYDAILSHDWGWNILFYVPNSGMRQYIQRRYPPLEDVIVRPRLSWVQDTTILQRPKEYGILVLGSHIPQDEYRRQMQQMPAVFRQVAERMAEVLRSRLDITPYEALRRTGLSLGITFTETELNALLPEMMVVADYVQMEIVLHGIHALLENGEEIYACGSSWLTCSEIGHSAFHVIHPQQEIRAEEVPDLLARAEQIYVPQMHGRFWCESWIGTALAMGVECLNQEGKTMTFAGKGYQSLADFTEELLHLED